jgi:FkbM family methyltransferase
MIGRLWTQVVDKVAWYLLAVQNLGLRSLVRLQSQKRFGADERLNKLTSRYLRNPVFARPNTSDYLVFGQIFVEREYKCLDGVKSPQLIIDCGANVGYSSAYFLSKFPSCFVIAVEPDPNNFAILRRNLEPYGDRCKAIQAAVWPVPERLQLQDPFLDAGKEWGRRVEKAVTNGSSQGLVEAVDLPTLIKLGGCGRVSILKVDIEGAEKELFSLGYAEWIDKVDNIVIELHGSECAKSFLDAIGSSRFKIATCGELTVCLSEAYRDQR